MENNYNSQVDLNIVVTKKVYFFCIESLVELNDINENIKLFKSIYENLEATLYNLVKGDKYKKNYTIRIFDCLIKYIEEKNSLLKTVNNFEKRRGWLFVFRFKYHVYNQKFKNLGTIINEIDKQLGALDYNKLICFNEQFDFILEQLNLYLNKNKEESCSLEYIKLERLINLCEKEKDYDKLIIKFLKESLATLNEESFYGIYKKEELTIKKKRIEERDNQLTQLIKKLK